MWLEIRNLSTKVAQATPDEVSWLDHYLSFDDPKAFFRMRKRGYTRMFNRIGMTFATGFLTTVRKGADESGVKLEFFDKRAVPCSVDPAADIGWLRDYQRDAVSAVVSKVRGIVKAPTGAGKTDIAVALPRVLPCRWLFVVHRMILMDQAADRYEKRTGMQAGRIGEGVWNVPDGCTFVCSTFQTLYARLQKPRTQALLQSVRGLIVDEVHTLPANSFWTVAMSIPGAYYRIGLSATPLDRDDKRSQYAVAATGPTIYKIRAEKLFESGILAKPLIRMVPVAHPNDGFGYTKWDQVQRHLIVRSDLRNAAVVDAVRRASKPCLVFVKMIEHGRRVRKALEDAGVNVEFVWGTDSAVSRQTSIDRLVRGDVDVLIASVIFNEGVDIPELRSVVIASGGKSVIAALQRVGRGMRNNDGTKSSFSVFDFDDRGEEWVERHTRARIKAYASEKYEVVVESPGSQRTLV